jgi:hypothetical protein
MKPEEYSKSIEFDKLQVGDIVRHIKSGEAYRIIHKVKTGHYVGIRTRSITNCDEWEKYHGTRKT